MPGKDIENISFIIGLALTIMNYAVDIVPSEYLKEKIRGILTDLYKLLSRVEANYDFRESLIPMISELMGIVKNR